MGVPDMLGTQGTFTIYTTNEVAPETTGGRQIQVKPVDGRVEVSFDGPPDPFWVEPTPMSVPVVIEQGDGGKVKVDFDGTPVELDRGALQRKIHPPAERRRGLQQQLHRWRERHAGVHRRQRGLARRHSLHHPRRQRQHRIGGAQLRRPGDLRLAVDELHHHGARPLVLPGHLGARGEELHAVTLDGATFGNVRL